ncbi:MAG: pentapeptide repeat-containing protein [Leptospiraceae bacterium]|nr:pentapeptide repeat-containing protein [Leptospiraceae bacterium]
MLSTGHCKSCNLQDIALENTDLSGSNLAGCDLRKGEIQGVKLQKPNLSECLLYSSSWKNADLQRANLSGADLQKASLTNVELSEANMEGANLSSIFVNNVNLRKARLRGANLSFILGRHIDFQGADLRGANLRGMPVEVFASKDGNGFQDANLPGQSLSTGGDARKAPSESAGNEIRRDSNQQFFRSAASRTTPGFWFSLSTGSYGLPSALCRKPCGQTTFGKRGPESSHRYRKMCSL